MRIAYLDCASGISGDMTLGALVDAGADLAAINAGLSTLGLPRVQLVATEVKKQGFRALQIVVEHEPEQKHRHLHHITGMLDRSQLSPDQRALAQRIFHELATAEAKVHGTTIEKVHFHEVGAVDSIADIVGTAIAWEMLGIEAASASPVPTGQGFVEIAHGRCSLPAPATAELLRGVPLAASHVACELTTPTGAAILRALVQSYGPPPAMQIDRIGYGAGQRDLAEQPNLLRLFLGQPSTSAAAEAIMLLETNLDDLSGEGVGFAIDRLWQSGALDVFTTAIQMKKHRPGVLLSVLCRPADAQRLESVLFQETTTLGVRRCCLERTALRRESIALDTPLGAVRGVVAELGAAKRFSPEYESCRNIAQERGVSLQSVYDAARQAWARVGPGPEHVAE